MADVTWLPTEEGTHAVVMGDLVTLCGEPGFLRSTTPEPGANVCPKCRALIEGMAAALKPFPVGPVLCGSLDCEHSCDRENEHECSTGCPCAAEEFGEATGEPPAEPQVVDLVAALRIYVSGPISGHPELNRPAFERAGEKLQQAGFDPIDPFDSKPACEAPEWADYMKADVAALVTCDGVATLSGWQESRGACVEVRLAQDLGIPVMALRRWTESR